MPFCYHLSPDGSDIRELGADTLDFKSHGGFIGECLRKFQCRNE